jgi:hypothetical protein
MGERLTFLDRIGTSLWDDLDIGRGTHVDWHRRVEKQQIELNGGAMWHEALKSIAATFEERGDRPHDVFWPRGIVVRDRVFWARAAVTSEKKVFEDLNALVPAYDDFDPECWQRLLAWTVVHRDLSSLETLEWLLMFAAVQRGLLYHVIEEGWKAKLFECLVSMANALAKDVGALPTDGAPLVGTTGNPYVWLSSPYGAERPASLAETRGGAAFRPALWENQDVG